MSLDYQLARINEWEATCLTEEGELKLVTTTLIWATMITDMGQIRKNNIDEWHFRIEYLHRCGMANATYHPTYDEIADHVGLRTNVCFVARQKWLRIVTRKLERRIVNEIEYEMTDRQENEK